MIFLNSLFCLNQKFSTTHLVTKEKPIIKNKPEDKFETVLFLPKVNGRKAEGGLRTQDYFKKSLPDKPLMTVITVVYNGEQHLEETMLSVLNQDYDNIEYIIVDGGSTDKTLEIIKKYDNAIDYWVSEPDKGIYDAMNKGITLSTGKVISLINSGDFYKEDTIKHIVNLENTRIDDEKIIIMGGLYRCDENGLPLLMMPTNGKDIDTIVMKGMPLNHPSTFVSMTSYKLLGLFDQKFTICGDYEFIFRAYHNSDINFIFTDNVLAFMRIGGVSDQFKSVWIRCLERFLIRKEKVSLLKNLFISIDYLIKRMIKDLMRNLLSPNILHFYYKRKKY